MPVRRRAVDPDVLDEANRLHELAGHPRGYRGPCYGPTLDEFRRAERNVKLRRAEEKERLPVDQVRLPREHAKLHSAHQHACITRGCGARYLCRQRCDPDSLADSLCPKCFEEACRA